MPWCPSRFGGLRRRNISTHAVLILHANEVGWADARATLRTLPEVSIIAEALSAEEAIDLAAARQPDVILTSATIATGSVVPALKSLHNGVCRTSTIGVFATRPGSQSELEAFAHLGVAGYAVWADLTHQSLRLFLQALVSCDLHLASRTAAQALEAMVTERCEPAFPLSDRELEVIQGLIDGLTQKQLAQGLGISDRRIRDLLNELERKFDAPTQFTLGYKIARSSVLSR